MIRRANYKDRPVILKILKESFRDDPYLRWLAQDCNRKNRMDVILEYVVDETFGHGEIYLTEDLKATALWNSEKKEGFSFRYIWRNLYFLLKTGIKGTVSVVRKDQFTHSQYPKVEKYYHLYMVGVLPEAQGKGLFSELINPMIEKMTQKSIPLFLKTANPHNVEIYQKKGFVVFKQIQQDDINIYFMSRQNKLTIN